MSDPVLPYAGSEGWSGTDTSQERAERNVTTAGARQDAVLEYLAQRGVRGATVTEVKAEVISHHGTASQVLTTLHTAGKILRLKDRRGGAKIYVIPEFRMGRVIEAFVGNAETRRRLMLTALIAELEEMREHDPMGEAGGAYAFDEGYKYGLDLFAGRLRQRLVD